MPRSIALVVLAGLLLASAPPLSAVQQTPVELQVALEERLLVLAEVDHGQLRDRQQEAEARAHDLAERLDELLEEDPPDLARVGEMEAALGLAEAIAGQAAEAARAARARVIEQHRRLDLLAALAARETPASPVEPLSGRWRVRILPSGQEGVFDLHVEGTLVQGSYTLDGGYHGSLRGTFVAGVVRLERIDAERGFDTTYEGRLDPVAGRIAGGWRATLLNSAGPSGGDWFAEKLDPR